MGCPDQGGRGGYIGPQVVPNEHQELVVTLHFREPHPPLHDGSYTYVAVQAFIDTGSEVLITKVDEGERDVTYKTTAFPKSTLLFWDVMLVDNDPKSSDTLDDQQSALNEAREQVKAREEKLRQEKIQWHQEQLDNLNHVSMDEANAALAESIPDEL